MNRNGFTMVRDELRCIACYECVIVCPQSTAEKQYPVLIRPQEVNKPPLVNCIENCIQCMTCWDVCRAQAIKFQNHRQVRRLAQDQAALDKVAKIL